MSFVIDLKGNVAIVTGAKAGIGAEIACHLAKAGADVAICGSSPEEKAKATVEKLLSYGVRAAYYQVDLSVEGNGTGLVEKVIKDFGKVDIVVNNAALATQDWEKAFRINVAAPLEIIEAAAQNMEPRGYGRIVNITSSATFSGGTPIPQYVSTKGATDSMSRFLAKRYGAKGILINAVAPGPVLTDMVLQRYSKEEFEAHYLSQMPIHRCLTSEDIAGSVLFLASSLCSGLCGQTLLCDGGRVTLGIK
jgi:NAD(P)-dependent dehydrogenase (short-subunit alcohol dehydrogenase family)